MEQSSQTRLEYINPAPTEFEVPEYRGRRYEALVPDTLDIAERSRLALNALTEATNPAADHEVYWIVVFGSDPPHMFNNCWQSTASGKFPMASTLQRLMTGSDANSHVDRTWMEVILKSQGPDGLTYQPLQGRPWAFVWSPVEADTWRAHSEYEDQLLSAMGNGAMMGTMGLLARRDGDGPWRDALVRLIDGMDRLAVHEGDLAFFWPSLCYAVKELPPDAQMPTAPFEAESSMVPHGLVQAYRSIGYEPALAFARKVINYLRLNFYAPDGSFLAAPGVAARAHFHAHARGLLAMEEYAEATGDDEVMAFAKSGYEWARGTLTNQEVATDAGGLQVSTTPGADLVGFFPEWANSSMGEKGETCQLADMIALALRLSEAGVGDYWDDADRWIRNQLAEGQLTNTDWVHRLPTVVPVQPHSTTDRVVERNLGAFAGGPDPNDWTAGEHMHVLGHCCTANGSKALYWIWERILRYGDGKLRVNLLLNRASRWADVNSYIPYAGRVELQIKEPVDLSVRIPEWVEPRQTRAQVNGEDRTLEWDRRYALIGPVHPPQVVTVSFPIDKRRDRVHIEKRAYTVVRKGNEVLNIDPPGRYCPLYQRNHYADDEPRWRKVTRFVSEEVIDW